MKFFRMSVQPDTVRSRLQTLAVLALLFATRSASADGRFSVESFEPAPAQAGSLLNVYGASTVKKRGYSLSAVASYGRKPLSIESGTNGKVLGDLVGSVGTLTLMGAVGLWDKLMQTLALMMVATIISVLIGIPLGILSARSKWNHCFVGHFNKASFAFVVFLNEMDIYQVRMVGTKESIRWK